MNLALFWKVQQREITLEIPIDNPITDTANEMCWLFFLLCPLGNYFIGAIVSFIGVPNKIENNCFQLIPSRFEIEKKIVLKREEILDDAFLLEKFEDVKAKYKKSDYTTVV